MNSSLQLSSRPGRQRRRGTVCSKTYAPAVGQPDLAELPIRTACSEQGRLIWLDVLVGVGRGGYAPGALVLQIPQFAEQAFLLGQQLLGGAVLDDAAFVQNDDAVGDGHVGESVGDQDDRAVGGEPAQPGEDAVLGPWVEGYL